MPHAFEIPPQKPVKKNQGYRTALGVWQAINYPEGHSYRDFRSHVEFLERPLINIRWGRDPNTGTMATAEGWIAFGQRASGFIAVGQFVNGTLSIGQFATGRVAAIGQFAAAPLAVGQFSIALAAIGQAGIAGWGIYQQGIVFFGGIGRSLLQVFG
jgi:hypothetical protein